MISPSRRVHRAAALACLVALIAMSLAPGWSAPAPVAAQEGVPLPTAPFGAHPRLLITQTTIDETLKPRAEAQTAGWVAFANYVESDQPEQDASWTPSTALRSLALAYLINRDPIYAQRGRNVMVTLVNEIEASPAMTRSGGLDGAFLDNVAGLAVGYDWLYAGLTVADRAVLEDVLWRAASVLRDPASDTDGIIWIDDQLSAFGNYEPRWLWALTAVSLALWGERQDAIPLMDDTRRILTETFIPALDIQEGGAWAEGPVYGFIGNWARAQTALAWWTAAGENMFDDTRWWYDRLAYDMFLNYPTTQTTYNAEWGDPIMGYPSIIGDSERYHPAAAYGRAQDLLLATVFEGTEHGRWMAWYLANTPPLPAWMAVDEFLWMAPERSGSPPTTATWIAPYNGHALLRSNWAAPGGELDPTAAYVSFNAGDRLAYHQFYDAGNLTIFFNGDDLLVRSGVYSGDGTSDHDANYYVRTIAGNTVLVCDLAEDFYEIRPNAERDVYLNDCGQRSMQPAPRTAINVDYLFDNWRPYDTGSLVRYGTTGDVTYLRADITGAYNSTIYATPGNRAKVSGVIRELIYWRPGIVIVSDRVVTTYPSYTPLQVFHFQTEPTLDGLFFRSIVDDSALYIQNMLPDSLVSTVEGYQVAGQIIDQSWGEPVSNGFESAPYGPWRLEITPNGPALEHWFMTAFVAQPVADPQPVAAQLMLGEGLRGIVRGNIEILFDPEPENGADVTEAAFQVPLPEQNAGIAVQYALVTGLAPEGTYRITGEGVYTLSISADEAGTILLPDPPPGRIRLEQVVVD